MTNIDRRTVLAGAAAGAALLTLPRGLRGALATADLQHVYAEIERRADESVARLQEWIRQPSINATGQGMNEGADLMVRLCRDAGFQKVERLPGSGASVVFGQLAAAAKRTIALYFMYDVKHVDESEWSSPPFAARFVEMPDVGRVVMGRGAVNQKGPQAMFLAALHAIRGAGRKPPVNLVLLAEGEEEDGSIHLPEAVRREEVQAALRGCQGMIMPSASQNLDGTVELTLGCKGCVEVELVAEGERWGRGPKTLDIHSGNRPAVDSVAFHLVQALASLVTPDGNDPAIDGLEAMVRPLTDREKTFVADAAARSTEADWKKELTVDRWARDMTFREALERIAGRPTVNIQGLVGGYTGPAGKTIIPHHLVAKLDLRLVPDMTASGVLAALRSHLDRRGFGDIEIRDLGSYNPSTTPHDSLPVHAALGVYRGFKIEPIVWPRMGGSWPGYLFTAKPLSLPAVHFGLGYGQGAHSKDEYFVIQPKGPKIAGVVEAVRSHVDMLYACAAE